MLTSISLIQSNYPANGLRAVWVVDANANPNPAGVCRAGRFRLAGF